MICIYSQITKISVLRKYLDVIDMLILILLMIQSFVLNVKMDTIHQMEVLNVQKEMSIFVGNMINLKLINVNHI